MALLVLYRWYAPMSDYALSVIEVDSLTSQHVRSPPTLLAAASRHALLSLVNLSP